MSGTGLTSAPFFTDSGPTGDQIELVLLITIGVIALVFFMAIGICCCFPKCCSGVANDEEKETSRKLRTPPSLDGTTTEGTKGGPLGGLTATDPGTNTSNTTKTTGTTTTAGTSASTKTTTTLLNKYFKKEEKRYIPPPSGPPNKTNKTKLSKINALPSKKGPAPQPPPKPSPKSPTQQPLNKVAKEDDDDTYGNLTKGRVASISQYSIFQKGKAKASNKPQPSSPSKPISPSQPRSASPKPSSPKAKRDASFIKKVVSEQKPKKKTSDIKKRKDSDVPTILIAPSDFQHIYSSKEKVIPKPMQPKTVTTTAHKSRPSSGPSDETTSTFFNNKKSRRGGSKSPKGPAPQPPAQPAALKVPTSPLKESPLPPPEPTEQQKRTPTEAQHTAAPSFPPPVKWDVDDEVTEIKTQPSDEMFREMFGNQRGSQGHWAEGENVTNPPSLPTIGERTPTDPTLEEGANNKAFNQEVVQEKQGPPPDQNPANVQEAGKPLQKVTASNSSQSVGSRKEQLDKLKNLLTKND